MKASDRIKYASISEKINKKNISDITEDEYEWLKYHPELLEEIKKQTKKVEIMSACVGNKGTIEEILFNLDLSDRLYR